MYDVYMKGKYQFTETTDLKNFKVIDSEVKMKYCILIRLKNIISILPPTDSPDGEGGTLRSFPQII